MKRLIFKTLATLIAISTIEAGAQVASRRVSFGSYLAENQKILSHRKKPQVQVAFQETGPTRSIASEAPAAGTSLPSIMGPNPAAQPSPIQAMPAQAPYPVGQSQFNHPTAPPAPNVAPVPAPAAPAAPTAPSDTAPAAPPAAPGG